MRFALGNVVDESMADPAFRIPPPELRENLEPGDLAELMLLSDRLADAVPAWAEVTDILGPGLYAGIFENGDPVEFSSEHVSDLSPRQDRPPMMGVRAEDPFNILRRRQKTEAPAPEPFQILRKSPSRARSPFQILRETPRETPEPAEAPRAAAAPPPQGAPRRGFFDWINIFRRKPKAEIEPIPAAERRQFAPAPPGLPAPVIEVAPVAQPQVEPPPVPEPPAEIVIIPPAPAAPASGGLIAAAAEAEPDPFTMIAPGPRAPAPPAMPMPTGALVVSEPMLPGAPLPDSMFDMIAAPSAEVPSSRGIVVRESDLPAAPSEALDPFTMIQAPMAAGSGELATVEPPSAFNIIAPPPADSPFDILGREERGIVPAQEPGGAMSRFDILETPGGGELAPYDPKALDPFTVIAPPKGEITQAPTAPGWGGFPPTIEAAVESEVEEEAEQPKKKRKKRAEPIPPKWVKKGKGWVFPSPEDMARWYKQVWNLPRFFDAIRSQRDDPMFQEAVDQEDWEGAFPLETIAYADMNVAENIADYFQIPWEVVGPMIEKIYKMNEAGEEPYEEEEQMWEWFHDFYNKSANPGVALLMPKDIPGFVFVTDYEDQVVFSYFENLSPAERRKRDQEARREEEREKAAAEERKKALRRIWGKIPTAEELVPFLESKFDLSAMFKFIKKERKKKGFQEAVDEEGRGVIFVEKIADEGEDFYNQVGYYFSLAPEIFELYLSGKEPLEQELWNEVLNPFFDNVAKAFLEVKPRDLPGVFEVTSDDGDGNDLYLEYVEEPE